MDHLHERIQHESRFFDSAMSEKDRIDLLVSRSAMSGSIVHQPKSEQEIVLLVQKIVPKDSLILVEKEYDFVGDLRKDYKIMTLTEAEDNALFSARAVITGVDFAIAETASIALSSKPYRPKLASTTAEIHIALVRPDQIISDLADLPFAMEKYYGKNIPAGFVLISGPSKTSDIEMNLVVGVHGPAEMHLFVY
jgi:L-lactate utilization protein LutC